jgi:hypothetical protein
VFAIIRNLYQIVKWGQDAFRKWFTRELLGANWKIVPQGDNVTVVLLSSYQED